MGGKKRKREKKYEGREYVTHDVMKNEEKDKNTNMMNVSCKRS